MSASADTDHDVERLGPHHDRTEFRCGVEALDRYLRQQAGQDTRRRFTSVYVLVHRPTGAVVGYYTLANASIRLVELPGEVARKLPRYPEAPATLLGRLAVDARHRGRGLGELLLFDAMRRSLDSSRATASFALVVDAKDEAARAFYLRYGFEPLVGSTSRLFLPMHDLERDFTQGGL